MGKTKWSDIKPALLHLAINRKSNYNNEFPGNCLAVYNDVVSADCIGLIKSIINKPSQAYADSGYVQPGLVIPDWTEKELIDACPDKSSDFRKLSEGEILMNYTDYGHGGWYVGEFIDPKYGSVQNVIECSVYDAGYRVYDGIFTTYVDSTGHKYTSKGGQDMGTSWEFHGHLNDFIDFDCGQPEAPSVLDGKKVLEVALAVCNGKYGNNPERKKKLVAEFGEASQKKIQDVINLAYQK